MQKAAPPVFISVSLNPKSSLPKPHFTESFSANARYRVQAAFSLS
jgi:hypothetical protein